MKQEGELDAWQRRDLSGKRYVYFWVDGLYFQARLEQAKQRLYEIWIAEGRDQAGKAFDLFVDSYRAKYPKATECLAKDRDALLAFYNFPAEHWVHIRTTNPIESTFATVRLRTAKTRGCLSRETASTMVFKLVLCAQRTWRKLNGSNWLAEVIEGVKFEDGIKVDKIAA